MPLRTLARALLLAAIAAAASPAAAADDATLFRVFLKDGGSLVSYGEVARMDGRVVFSMKTGASADAPLTLVNLDETVVDWARTDRYAYSARATHYLATRADADYAVLTDQIARTLSAVGFAKDPATRLRLVQNARGALARWPGDHYNFRDAEVRQMLNMLDDAIADLKAAAGDAYDLSLVAYADAPPPTETLLPPPTPQESIEGVLTAARLSDRPAERESLLSAAIDRIDVEAGGLPGSWAAATRADARASLQAEIETDRRYQAVMDDYTPRAREAARRADVPGLQWILARVRQRDEALGGKRPGMVLALVAEVNAQLDAARQLQLARDRWTLRVGDYRQYNAQMKLSLSILDQIAEPLQDIKSLAGGAPARLAVIERQVTELEELAAGVTPPAELASTHALIVSAANLAEHAARLRRDAILTGNIERAWDASSAAAGALLLGARARDEIAAALARPQLP
jgi:hypothetical protein